MTNRPIDLAAFRKERTKVTSESEPPLTLNISGDPLARLMEIIIDNDNGDGDGLSLGPHFSQVFRLDKILAGLGVPVHEPKIQANMTLAESYDDEQLFGLIARAEKVSTRPYFYMALLRVGRERMGRTSKEEPPSEE